MTTSKEIGIYRGDVSQSPKRSGRRMSARLVPMRRVVDSQAKEQDTQPASSEIESLKQQLGERSGQLHLAHNNLAKSNREFQQFANAVSHDLQAPLRAILGFSQYLQQEYQTQLDETANEYIDHVVDGASRMDQLLKGLVQFSRITSKAMPFDAVNLNDVLDDALHQLQDQIDRVGAVIKRDELPQISGDYNQLTLLLKHLIENGLKFNTSETTLIHVRSERVGDAWVICVCDNGIGIAPEHLESVFAIFRQTNLRQEFEGVGAGLAICRQIVDRHSGRIWLNSEQGVGTQASVSVPDTTVAAE